MARAVVALAFLALAAAEAPKRSPATLVPAPPTENAAAAKLRGAPPAAVHALAAAATKNATAAHVGAPTRQMPCQCVASDPSWVRTTRTTPKCLFIDLGAADGNTLNHFLNNGYGPVAQCPSGQWEAVLVEANPRFDATLKQVATNHPGSVHAMTSTAAYMCEAQTSFYLDTTNHAENYWGSSMNNDHPDAQKSGLQQVTVPTANVNRILFENTIPGDWVMLKMDIEGSEWDVVPCLAQSPAASLIDRFYIEDHKHLPASARGMAGTTPAAFEAAKTALRARGVDIPDYFSETL